MATPLLCGYYVLGDSMMLRLSLNYADNKIQGKAREWGMAVSGQTIEEAMKRLSLLHGSQHDILVMIGTNDVKKGALEQERNLCKERCRLIHALRKLRNKVDRKATNVLWCTLPPIPRLDGNSRYPILLRCVNETIRSFRSGSRLWTGLLVSSLLMGMPQGTAGGERKGPHFTAEPPQKVDFSSITGVKVECFADASPRPRVDWLKYDGTRVERIPGVREVFSNGTLLFPPFDSEKYRQDVHDSFYQCRVSNSLGTIISRNVKLRAVVKQKYEIQIFDEYVIKGNTAVFRCQVPSYASDFIIVTSWVQDGLNNIYPNTDTDGKYMVMPNGDLYIFRVNQEDTYNNFGCRTVHKVTGEVQSSNYPARIVLTDEPKIGTQPTLRVDKRSRRQVKFGDRVVLPCLAQGHPLPTYRWFREDKEKLTPIVSDDRVFAGESGILQINKARFDDRGKYICRINNTVGEEEIQVILTVTAPLSVHMQPPNQEADMGSDASIVCNPSGYPINRVSWYKNGQPLVINKRYNITTNPDRLYISPITKEDQGMYQCFVHNEWDVAQAIAEIQLGDSGPELLNTFSEQTLHPGPPISLKCVATGNPPPQFTWVLDGFPIPDSSRFLVGQYVTIHDDVVSHVNISSIKEEDGGEYTCIAKNSVGEISHSARINVYGLPFIRVMSKITAIAGNDLIIKCPVAGYPIESITWERDGTSLPINRRQRVYNNGTLVIEHAQRGADAGTYTCQAQSRHKTARRDVEVQVLLPPKILPIQPMTNVLREGMRGVISCQILEGDLPLNFKWERNGKEELGEGAVVRRIDEFSTSLIIEKIKSSHSSNYTCIAQNIAGLESFTVPLTVNVPPRWTIEPIDTNVVLGFDVVLNCQADGYPEPTIMWKKAVGDRPGEYKDFLYEPNINFYRNGSLEFLSISKESEGYYLCEARNGISNGISKVVFLNVNSPAFFQQKTKQVHVEKGEHAHLQCTALGDSPISILWKTSNQIIGKSFNPRYTIREQHLDEGEVSELGIADALRQDTGVFHCSATNDFGQDEMTIHLVVQEIPEIPKNVRSIDQQSRSLQISWTQPYPGNSPITSYIIQYKLVTEPWEAQPTKIVVPGSQTVATIVNLHPAATYHLRILAENKLGLSDPSEVIQITTLEEEPNGSPQDIAVEAKSSTELYVSWEAPPKETWNGNLLGYYVGYSELNGATPSEPMSQYTNIKTIEIGSQFGGQTVLDNLAMFTTYSISIQAFNSRGAGPTSKFVTARTKEGVPTQPPANVKCITLTATALDVWWEPPPYEGRNGYIQGYKVYFFPSEEWYEQDEAELKSTTSLRTTLLGLIKYTNYSISVLSYTNSGDGVLSAPIFCRTAEDVPSAPEDIKASLSDHSNIVVTWLPPKYKNGELTGYTIYMGIVENGKEGGSYKHFLSPAAEEYVTNEIADGSTYQFWVTASTSIGEGTSTRVATVTPTNKSKILSFSRHLTTPWKQNITLPCQIVGLPTPRISWKYNGKGVEHRNSRYEVRRDGTLVVHDIQHSDTGNYSCFAENIHGSDVIVYQIAVRVPPEPPVLQVVRAESDRLHLKWTNKGIIDIPILGYIIHYKRDQGDWEELQLRAKEMSHVLTNLWCGTQYKLYMTAYNKIATGLPCDIVNARTKGSVPEPPTMEQLVRRNSTAISFWLEAWGDGGCPILYMVVEYREDITSDWHVCSNSIQQSDIIYTVSDLRPASPYYFMMEAHNSAGMSQEGYNISTLRLDGTPVLNMNAKNSTVSSQGSKAVMPISLMFLTFVCVILGWVYFKKRKESHRLALAESLSVAQMQNQHNRDQQYAVQGGQLPAINIEPAVFKDLSDRNKDVCPYATFQLNKQTYHESTCSGNVYSGPYHSVRGSFVYHDLPSGTDTFKGRHLNNLKEPEYTKVRRKCGRLPRDAHPESQVDLLHGPEESSSSSERSPTGHRKLQCPHSRKLKGKLQSSIKKSPKGVNGYATHAQETSFSFAESIKPPSRFSDNCPEDFDISASRHDRLALPQPYRLSRESTFQIDV